MKQKREKRVRFLLPEDEKEITPFIRPMEYDLRVPQWIKENEEKNLEISIHDRNYGSFFPSSPIQQDRYISMEYLQNQINEVFKNNYFRIDIMEIFSDCTQNNKKNIINVIEDTLQSQLTENKKIDFYAIVIVSFLLIAFDTAYNLWNGDITTKDKIFHAIIFDPIYIFISWGLFRCFQRNEKKEIKIFLEKYGVELQAAYEEYGASLSPSGTVFSSQKSIDHFRRFTSSC